MARPHATSSPSVTAFKHAQACKTRRCNSHEGEDMEKRKDKTKTQIHTKIQTERERESKTGRRRRHGKEER